MNNMFRRKRWHRVTAILLSLTMLITSVPAMAFAESTNSSEEPDAGQDVPTEEMTLEDTLILEEGLSEEMIIEEESTETSTTFDLGNGKKTIIYHGQQVRYEDENGNLTDYDPSLVLSKSETSINGQDLTGYTYENKKGDIKQYIPETLDEETPLLMEKDDYVITIAPYQEKEKKEKVKRKKEEYLMPYEQIEEKNLTAVYEGDKLSYEYQSMNQGIKETLVLYEIPESNEFSYLVTAKGMEAELLESGVITFTDRKTGKEAAYIDKPFMNDATGEAYSEEIGVTMEKKGDGEYIVTYVIDEAYLHDEERVYPISIDPTATWKGDDEFKDVYVISGDYADINFYDSDVRLMVAGKGIDGTYRTYIKIPNIKGTLDGYFVESAYITVYESGDCEANQTIRFNRITESWTSTSITWNNKPAYYSTAINSFTTEGTQYAAHKVKATNTIRNYLNDTNNPNYGIVMRNVTSSPDFAEFYGSRTSLTSYRPKLVVTYSDPPTVPATLTLEDSYLTTDELLEVSWTGIESAGLDRVQYRIAKCDTDGTVTNSTYVDWSTLKTTTSSSGSATLDPSDWSAGRYRIYIRGVDDGGMKGTSKSKTFYIDRTRPSYSSVSVTPSTTETSKSKNLKPTIGWNITETYLDTVSIYMDTLDTDGLIITDDDFENEDSYTLTKAISSGTHKFCIVAKDKAGNTRSTYWKYYYADAVNPEITSMSTPSEISSDTTPAVTWKLSDDEIKSQVLTVNGTAISGITASARSWTGSTGIKEGKNTIKLTVTDYAGNTGTKTIYYTLDTTKPAISSFTASPDASAAPSTDTTPVISWKVADANLSAVYYSVDSTSDYQKAGTAAEGSLTLPAITTDGTHTIRLKAIDKAGNESAVKSLTYKTDTTKPVFSSCSLSPSSSEEVPSTDTTPELSWTVTETNLSKVSYSLNDGDYQDIGTSASGTFALPALTEAGSYTIKVRATDKAGNVSTVRTLTYYLDADAPVFNTLDISQSSFLVPSANRSPQIAWNISDYALKNLSYSMDGVTYTEIGTAAEGMFSLPDTVWGDKTSGRFTIYVKATDTAGNETIRQLKYYLGEAEDGDYVPDNLTAAEYYGKRILTWDINAYDEAVAAYELHRGTEEDFIASNATKLEEDLDLTSLMYMDKEILSSDTYYYRIIVRDLNAEDGITASGSITAEYVNEVTEDQFSNRMGYRDYLSYLEVGLPTGTMNIEESSGNLVYDQSDYSFTVPAFSMDMDRVYNSRSGRTSMVGTGWTDSYHQEIYTSGDDLYFVDTDGSAYHFEKQENGSFICAETKAFTLTERETGYTITSKDNIVSTFNENGQLIKMTETNGYALENIYDAAGRMTAVKLSHGETEIRSLEFVYGEDSYLLSSVALPDDSVIRYNYTGNSLTGMEYGGITYRYEYDDEGQMTAAFDGEGNRYAVLYHDQQAVQVTYPDEEKFAFQYDDNYTTIEKQTSDGDEFYTETTAFDPATGKILSHTDPEGDTVYYAYDFAANPYLLTESSEMVTYYTLEDSAEAVSESAETKAIISAYTYDERENILTETAEDGSVTTYTYCTKDDPNPDPDLVKNEVTVRDGMTTSGTSYVYDEKGNVIESTDILTGQVTEYGLDEFGNALTETVTESGITLSTSSSTYDIHGNVLTSETTGGGVTNTSSSTYDSMGRTLTTSSPGTSTTYTYDALGREIQSVTTEDGLADVISTKTYDKNGTLLSESTTGGTSSEYIYDTRNRVVCETVSGEDIAPRTTATSYGYTGTQGDMVYVESSTVTGNVSLFSSESPSQTQTQYIDGAGKVLMEVDNQLQTEYTYDKSGNVLTAETTTADAGAAATDTVLPDTDIPNNNTAVGSGGMSYNTEDSTLTLYNEYGEGEVQITEPEISLGEDENAVYALSADSLVTRQTFDGAGNLKTETDPEGITAVYNYDARGRLTSCDINGDGINDMTVSYTLTADGSTLTTITDANGNVRTETTSAAGLVLETRDIASEEGTEDLYTKYTYDAQGRKTKEEYSDGTYIVYSYTGDYSSRVAAETAYLADGSVESETAYTYDTYGRVKSITVGKDGNTVSSTSWTYDAEGKKLSESVSYGLSTSVAVTEYSYDALGRLSAVTYPDESGLGIIYYIYDSNGNLSRIENSEGTLREYSYSYLGQLDHITDYTSPKTDTETPSYFRKKYTYDNNGRVTAIAVQSSDGITVESFSYTYDDNSQILTEKHANNLLEESLKFNETTSYTYDSFGRLIQSSKQDNTAENATAYVTTYGYDAVGNRISMNEDGTDTTYTYNSLNQLVSAVEGNTSASYTYDGRGNQTSETKGSVTTESAYSVRGEMLTLTKKSGDTVISSQENEYNHDGIRISKKEDGITRYYYYDNGIVAYTKDGTVLSSANLTGPEGQVIGTFRGEDYHIYLKDIQGSTTNIVKDDGTLSAAYEYSDFGETEEITGSTFDNEICYTGAVYDDTTGLYYMNARYYDPENGRFISQDTYRGELNDPGQWHLYVYCANNPINYTDPSGHGLWSFIDKYKPISFKYRWIKRSAVATAIDVAFGIIGGVSITALEKYAKKFFKKYIEERRKKKLKKGLKDKILDIADNLQNKGKELYNKLYEDAKNMKKGKKRDFLLSFLGKNKVKNAIKATTLNNISGFLDGFVVELVTGYKYYDCLTSASGFLASAVDYAVDKELYSGKIYLCALD